jgi:transcriptional regulator with XRE-family HTH domain
VNTKIERLWQKLKSKRYREQFVSAQVKRGIPFQIRALMKKQELTQEKLALKSGLAQGVISRAADPNNGNLTLNTIIRVAAGLDVAFVGMFVPFSELVKWYSNMSEKSGEILTFTQEDERFQSLAVAAALAGNADVNTPPLGDLEPQLNKTRKFWRATGKYEAKADETQNASAMDALARDLTKQPTVQ